MAFFTDEETLDREELNHLQRRKLAGLLEEVLASNRFYQAHIRNIHFNPMSDDLNRLPLTTRAQIEQDQKDQPPYGTILTYPGNRYVRLHHTSGTSGVPLNWLDTAKSWAWFKRCWSIVFRGAGVDADDRVLFPFTFGPFIGFWAAFEAAADLGNFCLPAGGMTTAARLRYLLEHAATVVCCTPTYALRMAEVAASEGVDLRASPVRALIVAGEPGGSVTQIRSRIEDEWNARVFDHAGMTEIGAYAFECVEAPGGMHVIESEFIAEVIDPASGAPISNGQAGELVLTNLGRAGSPLIRYRTGDRVVLSRGKCPCGRSFARICGGIAGRTDDMIVVRGNNVFPSALDGIIREFREVAEYRMTLADAGPMADLRIEVEPHAGKDDGTLAGRIEGAIRDRLHFGAHVSVVGVGTLPRFEMKARRVVRRNT